MVTQGCPLGPIQCKWQPGANTFNIYRGLCCLSCSLSCHFTSSFGGSRPRGCGGDGYVSLEGLSVVLVQEF